MSAVPSLPVDDDLLARVDAFARSRQVSRDVVLQLALTEYLDANADIEETDDLQPWQRAQIERGIADLDRGAITSREDIERILAKFD